MNLSEEQLIEQGWKYIGLDGDLAYFAKRNTPEEVLYIAVHKGKTLGNARIIKKNVLNHLLDFFNR